ncbi:MAG: hypothetical protein KatS3mg115_2412 [Candidatus Poribacteria bacterium]|nr:MAG: hypothetical protein KatS3mg115_2412 [Candidatus Poribacteria bacterium]
MTIRTPAPSEALQRPHPFISASVWDDFRAWNRSADYVLTERFDLQVFGHAPEHPTV